MKTAQDQALRSGKLGTLLAGVGLLLVFLGLDFSFIFEYLLEEAFTRPRPKARPTTHDELAVSLFFSPPVYISTTIYST